MNLSYSVLLDQVKAYHPAKYNNTRNYLNGHVTAWSPYISRGLLSPLLVMDLLRSKYTKQEWIGFMQQMAWREYFQRVWQHKGDQILTDLKSDQVGILLNHVPSPILQGNTGIHAIDEAIHDLYEKGYLHNHMRMYLAMLDANIFKAAWLPGAMWMYGNLLDHDPAANFLSWQWVAGTFSSKQYVANQENINRYTNTKQLGTFLDMEYEKLPNAIFNEGGKLHSYLAHQWTGTLDQVNKIDTVSILSSMQLAGKLPQFEQSSIDPDRPFCIYNSFNLDPLWHAGEKANRILLLEPQHYTKFPVAEHVLQFIADLAKANIEGLQFFIGSFEELMHTVMTENNAVVYFKEHPTTAHYKGIEEQRDWIFPEVSGYFPSFFGYWKKCERFIK